MPRLVITNVRPWGGDAVDVRVEGGCIAEMGPGLPSDGVEIVDGAGRLLLPGLVEAHTHLDKTLLGMGWYRNEVGPRLLDRIENERRYRREHGIDPERQSARQALHVLALGTTHIRSHVDVDTEVGLAGIEGVMATRDALRELTDIELVAFPQSGMLVRPGTVELMDQAMALGCEVVGGLDPCAIDRDPKGHLDAVFDLAQRHGRPVDIHLHEPGELGAFSMALIIERTRALGMEGEVTISHAFCLGMTDREAVARLVEDLAELNIHIATTAPPSRPTPSVALLRAAGVVIAGGTDGVRDTWSAYGNGDMLERAMLVGLKNNFRRDDEIETALDVCTYAGASLMGLERYGLDVGCDADLVLLPGETVAEAVVTRPVERLVFKRGRPVADNGRLLAPTP